MYRCTVPPCGKHVAAIRALLHSLTTMANLPRINEIDILVKHDTLIEIGYLAR